MTEIKYCHQRHSYLTVVPYCIEQFIVMDLMLMAI
jgi:hypothetical protein